MNLGHRDTDQVGFLVAYTLKRVTIDLCMKWSYFRWHYKITNFYNRR